MLLIEEEELEGTYEFIKRRDFNKISVDTQNYPHFIKMQMVL